MLEVYSFQVVTALHDASGPHFFKWAFGLQAFGLRVEPTFMIFGVFTGQHMSQTPESVLTDIKTKQRILHNGRDWLNLSLIFVFSPVSAYRVMHLNHAAVALQIRLLQLFFRDQMSRLVW